MRGDSGFNGEGMDETAMGRVQEHDLTRGLGAEE